MLKRFAIASPMDLPIPNHADGRRFRNTSRRLLERRARPLIAVSLRSTQPTGAQLLPRRFCPAAKLIQSVIFDVSSSEVHSQQNLHIECDVTVTLKVKRFILITVNRLFYSM